MTVAEIVYACLDLTKAATSDDSYFVEEHVIFLLRKFRSFLIKKEQDKEKGSEDIASEFEYQQICLDLEPVEAIDGFPCAGFYLRSTEKIPKILEGTRPVLYPTDYFQGTHINYVSRDRMRYVGSNSFLKNITYAALGGDLHLYLNSQNPQFKYMKKLRMSALFEDFDEAAALLCDDDGSTEGSSCDVLDAEFPIREYLVPPLIELVVKELSGVKYQPKDSRNDGDDTLAKVNVRN